MCTLLNFSTSAQVLGKPIFYTAFLCLIKGELKCLYKDVPKTFYSPCGIVVYAERSNSLPMLITSIWAFSVFGISARGRVKLPLLVGEPFLGN